MNGKAVVERNGKKFIFLVRQGRAVMTAVTTGAVFGDMVEITSGAASGDRAVLNPPGRLKNGSRVKINEQWMDSGIIVSISKLNKSYHRGDQTIPVLTDISFDIAEGEFLALMGPSGSGKSTLLNLIAGIDQPDSGSIIIGDVDVTTLSETELAGWRALNVGFIFQFYNLIPVLTAFENVELPLILTPLSRAERKAHVEMALRVVGLADRMDHYPGQLSGGQEQRVAIARAIVIDPTILVADEPTGDLDRVSAEEIMDLMDRLNQESKKTIIMVTHDPRAARKAHVIRHLDKGILTNADSQNTL